MVLQQYFEQKKDKIDALLSNQDTLTNPNIKVRLSNDFVFTTKGKDELNEDFPLVMFMYDKVDWNTSSEKEYKADVHFSIYVVFDATALRDFDEVFTIAGIIDNAVLNYPNREDIRNNPDAITNAAFKVSECQLNMDEVFWEKNHHFIWKICYKTTLIEKELKKKYTLITNNFITTEITSGNVDEVSTRLRAEGYELQDYIDVDTFDIKTDNGNDLFKIDEVDEVVNEDKKDNYVRDLGEMEASN